MLASPLAVGVIAGGGSWVQLPLALFWLVGYLAFYATSVWLKARRRPKWWPPVRAYALTAGGLGLLVAALRPDLLRWAPFFVLPLGVGLWAAAARRERDLLAGLTTVVGSSLMTVVAYDAGPGEDLHRAWLLAGIQCLYFAGTVCYVKSIIREHGNPRYYWLNVGYHTAAAALAAVLSWWLGLVFVALLIRAVWVPRYSPSPKQVGIGEVFATVAVALTSLLTV